MRANERGWRPGEISKCVASIFVVLASFAAPAAAGADVRITTVSTRADLVSGGDARLEVRAPACAGCRLRVAFDGRDVSVAFAPSGGNRFSGLLTGLKLGNSVVTARMGADTASLALVNHPSGGPLFAGPQSRTSCASSAGRSTGRSTPSRCSTTPGTASCTSRSAAVARPRTARSRRAASRSRRRRLTARCSSTNRSRAASQSPPQDSARSGRTATPSCPPRRC
jgi:hypothetical protein